MKADKRTNSSVMALFGCAIALAWLPTQGASHERSAVQRPIEARLPVLSDSDAWDRLPDANQGGGGPLPVWARTLANSLPRTTAAMLELDYLHRAQSPLDPKLRAMMRWEVARANRCDYSIDYAVADLNRTGLKQREVEALADSAQSPAAESAAREFARKLTIAADTVTDEEVSRLIERYGEKQVVAMVLLVAHANFQDRLFLSLGIHVEPNGPLPPVHVRFAKDQSGKSIAPKRNQPDEPSVPGQTSGTAGINDEEWLSFDIAKLQGKLAAQRDRPGRIPVPTWDDVREWLPERVLRNDPLRIKWSLVCVGYQPELALAWSACTRAFAEEAKQDRVFEESLFWVITRTIHCFY